MSVGPSAVFGRLIRRPFWIGAVLLCAFAPIRAAEQGEIPSEPSDEAKKRLEELLRLEIPVVESASKVQQKATQAPASVTVITDDEIKRYGHRTLAEVLQTVPGLHVSNNRNYSFLGTRGFNRGDYNSRVLVLVDGHRVNNNLTDGGFIGTEFILDVDLIEKVEVIRGPSAVLYGNNAFFGVINVVTRKGRDLPGYGAEASGEYAEFDTYKARATYGRKLENGLEFLFSGSYYDSAGPENLFFKEFNSPATNNGVAHRANDDHFESAFGKLSFRDLTLEGAFNTRERGDPTGQYGTTFNDPRSRSTDDRGFASLRFDHEFPDVVDVHAKVYYDRNTLDGRLASGTVFRDQQAGEWWGTELQLNKPLWERHLITLGAEYRDDFRQERELSDTGTGALVGRNARHTSNWGIYLNSDFAVRTNLHLNAGARYDQYGGVDPTANPRVALIYNPWPSSTFKAIYGAAFRAPNFFERALNPNLDPETITTYELAYEQELGSRLRSSVSVFYNDIDELIGTRVENGFTVLRNLSGATAAGAEVALEANWTNGILGRISFTRQETEDRDMHTVLPDSPRNLVKFNLSVPVWERKVFFSAEVLASDRRAVIPPAAFDQDAPGYGIVNLTLLGRELVKGLELSASVYNLFDNEYKDPATPFQKQNVIVQDGRSFRLKVTYRF